MYNQGYYIVQPNAYQQQQPEQLYMQEQFQQNNMNCNDDFNKEQETKFALDLKKTKMCPNIKAGFCSRGSRCNFAHSNDELRIKPNLSKTRMCPNLTKKGTCEFGDNCNFAHSELELRSTPDIYKTSLCNSFKNGECKVGDLCRFAHGEEELRPYLNEKNNNYYQNNNFNKTNNLRPNQNGYNKQSNQRINGRQNNFQNNKQSYGNKSQNNTQGKFGQQQMMVDPNNGMVYQNGPIIIGNSPQNGYVMQIQGGGQQMPQISGQYPSQQFQGGNQQIQIGNGQQQPPQYGQINMQQMQQGQQIQQGQMMSQQMVGQVPQNIQQGVALQNMK